MELNTRGRYAVMAMADIADHAYRHARTHAHPNVHAHDRTHDRVKAVPLSDIASRQALPIAYLEQLFAKLRAAGLVESVRGRAGGYRLARPASSIAIAEIMAAAEEQTRMTRCMGPNGPGCIADERCLTHGLWSALGRHINGFLANVTLADVVEPDAPYGQVAEKSEARGA